MSGPSNIKSNEERVYYYVTMGRRGRASKKFLPETGETKKEPLVLSSELEAWDPVNV